MTKITWSRERQQSLLGQLSGFWKGDIWDMRDQPAANSAFRKNEAAASTFRLQICDHQRRTQVCVLEEVLRWRLEKYSGTGESSPHGEVAE